MKALDFWLDEITWRRRRVSFFCGACGEHRTTTCDVDCIEEVGHGAREKYEVIGPDYEIAHKCA